MSHRSMRECMVSEAKPSLAPRQFPANPIPKTLEGQRDFVSRLIPPKTHIVTLINPHDNPTY